MSDVEHWMIQRVEWEMKAAAEWVVAQTSDPQTFAAILMLLLLILCLAATTRTQSA